MNRRKTGSLESVARPFAFRCDGCTDLKLELPPLRIFVSGQGGGSGMEAKDGSSQDKGQEG